MHLRAQPPRVNGGRRQRESPPRRRAGRLSSACRATHVPGDLLLGFQALQRPVYHDTRYKPALEKFVTQATLAYECGWTQEGLQSALQEGRGESGEAALLSERELVECITYCCIVWLTLSVGTPKSTVVRWAAEGAQTPVVGLATAQAWSGFVKLICRGYFEKRMAWYPLDRLQLELSLTTSRRDPPALVAELAQVVFTTLHQAAPQFPTRY